MLSFILLFLLTSNSYAAPQIIEAPKNPDGSIVWMNYEQAEQYCASLGGRLPTIRELAGLAEEHGAWGIWRAFGQYPNDLSYLAFRAINKGGEFDYFYYSSNGFPYYPKDLDGYFWSQSVKDEDGYPKQVYRLSGMYGDIMPGWTWLRTSHSARCVLEVP